MSAIWTNHAGRLLHLINSNNELQAHLYLEQLMLFPEDIQNKIIEDISHLTLCNRDAVAKIISDYTTFDSIH